MSTYCERTDIENCYGATNVKTWSDLDNDGDATKIAARITAVIASVSSFVDGKMRRSKYSLPLLENGATPPVIVTIAAKLCGVELYEGRGIQDFNPDTGGVVHKLVWNKKEAERLLEQILDGSITLGALTTVTASMPAPEVV